MGTENNMEVQVISFFSVNLKHSAILKEMDGLSENRKQEFVAKAVEGVVETVLKKHFTNDEKIAVGFVKAEIVPQ